MGKDKGCKKDVIELRERHKVDQTSTTNTAIESNSKTIGMLFNESQMAEVAGHFIGTRTVTCFFLTG